MDSTLLANGTVDAGLSVRTRGRTRVALHRIDVPAGADSGWHYHPGPVIAVVASGTVTRTLADGTVQTTGAGGVIVELEGPDRVHHFHNYGPRPLTIYALYLPPADAPLFCPAPAPDQTPGPDRPDSEPGSR
ncbi:cupin domain-containing protein [Streptomyces aurantiacus]|uniref:cupin domain-containing protein n=1 Tax=Streptomyces aurantiacus TaxID=47760 RepID=UPI00131A1F7B|nr:cupin domain-containing protein [Streptomyces aurantiacus]